MSGQLRIELYVDTCCPFAWIGHHWLAEVGRHRAVELALHLVRLPMRNEREAISIGCRPLLAHTWKPARVPTGAVVQHGPEVLTPLYEEIARRIFVKSRSLVSDPRGPRLGDRCHAVRGRAARPGWSTKPRAAPAIARPEPATRRPWHTGHRHARVYRPGTLYARRDQREEC